MSSPAPARRVLVSGALLGQAMGGVRRHHERVFPHLARLCLDAGWSVDILEGNEPIAFELPDTFHRIPTRIPPRPILVRATLEGRAVRRALLEAEHSGSPYDLFHTGHLPIPRALSIPHTITIHDLRDLESHHTPLSRRLVARGIIGRAVQQASAVLTVSESVRSQLVEHFRLPPERVVLVGNGVDHFEPLPRSSVPGAGYLLHVGHLEPRKNLALLIEALAQDPNLPDLVLAGAPKGGEGERLRGVAQERGVLARVDFRGPFSDEELPALYRGAACVVLPSRLEGFGIPALEAQYARVPLAISSHPALGEVAGPGVPTFPADDPAACAFAIRMAMETPAQDLEAKSRRAAGFRWSAVADRWFESWRMALDLGRPRPVPPLRRPPRPR